MSYDTNVLFAIFGLGAATPIGRSAAACAAAVRAGVSAFSHHPIMGDSEGRPVSVSQCPWLLTEQTVATRISDCLISAIRQALVPLGASAVDASRGVELYVNLPSPRPGLPDSLQANVRAALDSAFERIFARVAIGSLGHAGSLVAMRSAARRLRENPTALCIVAGADSYMDLDTLEWLEDTGQLHGAGERNNAWGFIPGEGAGALLAMSLDQSIPPQLPMLGQVIGVGVAEELNLNRTGTVCLGEGLTRAIGSAMDASPSDPKIHDVYCDMNGDPYRADEFAFAVSRLRERFISASDFVAPADCWGDVGAASAVLNVNLACIAAIKGYSAGQTSLVWGSSDTGQRGAALIRATTVLG